MSRVLVRSLLVPLLALLLPAAPGRAGDHALVGSEAVLLGQGYDSHARRPASICVTGDAHAEGAWQSLIWLDEPMRAGDAAALLGAGGEWEDQPGVAGGASLARVLRPWQEDGSARVLTFAFRVGGRRLALLNPTLSAKGLEMRADPDVAYRYRVCGDEIVDEVELGGVLVLSIRLDFGSDQHAKEFARDVSLGDASLYTFGAQLRNASRYYKQRVGITIAGRQLGGDPSQLRRILGVTSGGDVPALRCSTANFAACEAAAQALVDYATDLGGFRAQFKDGPVTLGAPDGPAVIAFRTRRWGEVPVSLGGQAPDPLDPTIVAARIAAGQRLRAVAEDHAALRRLLAQFALTTQDREALQTLDRTLDADESLLRDAHLGCYDAPPGCLARISDANARWQPYDPARIRRTEDFLDHCLRRGVDAGVARTLTALVRHYETSDCFALADQMVGETVLTLRGASLDDLRPLVGMTHLARLDLRGNALTSLAPLAALPALEALDVRGNALTAVPPGALPAGLRVMDLSYNRLTALPASAVPTGVKVLRVHGNPLAQPETVRAALAGRVQSLLVTEHDVCQAERDWLLAQGVVPRELKELYDGIDFAPEYARPGDRSSGIEGWSACVAVARGL